MCILSAVNVGKIKSDEEVEELCDLSVRGLDELIDYQKYPVLAAERATKARRSLKGSRIYWSRPLFGKTWI